MRSINIGLLLRSPGYHSTQRLFVSSMCYFIFISTILDSIFIEIEYGWFNYWNTRARNHHQFFLSSLLIVNSRLLLLTVKAINDKLKSENSNEPPTIYTGPPVIRVTLASVEETSMLLSRGLDFYGATFFPTETPHPISANLAKYKNNRWVCSE